MPKLKRLVLTLLFISQAPAGDSVVPGGGIYSHHFQELRENTIKLDKVQCWCGFCAPLVKLTKSSFGTISGDLGRFRHTFY